MLSHVRLFANPWTIVHLAPLSMEFSRQEYWSGLPFSSPGNLPNLGVEPGSPSEPPGKPIVVAVKFSVMSNSLQSYGLRHTRLPCPSPSPRVCSNLCPWESVIPSNHLILCHPLLLLPSIFPRIRVFSNESVLHIRWPKYWSFSFSISPSNEYSGLTFFRIDWFDLLTIQGTLKSLLQHHNSKASIL